MNRPELQRLTHQRVREAEALLAAGLWSGAYYLAGYAIELGLKSCILAHIERTGAIFRDKKFSEKCWTHSANDLVELAGLAADLGRELAQSKAFSDAWKVVKDWTEAARHSEWSEAEARALYAAVTNDPHGILRWVTTHW